MAEGLEVGLVPWVAAVGDGDDVVDVGGSSSTAAALADDALVEDAAGEASPSFGAVDGLAGAFVGGVAVGLALWASASG
jgi:hypothetical protein